MPPRKKHQPPVEVVFESECDVNEEITLAGDGRKVDEKESSAKVELVGFKPSTDRLWQSMLAHRTIWGAFSSVEKYLLPLAKASSNVVHLLEKVRLEIDQLGESIDRLESSPANNKSSSELAEVVQSYERWWMQLRDQWQTIFSDQVQRPNREKPDPVTKDSSPKPPAPMLLQKRPINTFSEDPKLWLRFRHDLDRMKEDTTYSTQVKFDELLRATEGSSKANVIVRKHAYSCNLEGAIDELIEKFEDPCGIIDRLQRHVKTSVKFIPEKHNAQHWQDLYCEVQFVKEQLNLAKADVIVRNQMVQALREKLPDITRSHLRRAHGDFDRFVEFVEEMFEAQQAMDRDERPQSAPSRAAKQPSKPGRRQVAAVGTDQPAPSGQSTRPKSVARQLTSACVFCPSDGHPSRFCPKSFEERRVRAWEQGICFRCLQKQHPCTCTERCSFCDARHHLLLCKGWAKTIVRENSATRPSSYDHGSTRSSGRPTPPPRSTAEPIMDVPEHRQSACIRAIPVEQVRDRRGTPVRQLIRCEVSHQGRVESVWVFIDPGSEVTLVHPSVLERLGMAGTTCRRMVITGPGSAPKVYDKQVAFRLASVTQDYWCRVQAWIYPELDKVIISALPRELVEEARNRGVHVSSALLKNIKPDLIIGVDYGDQRSFTPTEVRRITPSVLASRLPFGWAIRGYYEFEVDTSIRHVASFSSQPEPCPCGALRDIFNIDEEEKQSKASLEIEYDPAQCRYVVKLPWIGQHRPTNNYGSARAQALALRKALQSKGLLTAYHEAISEFVTKDYAEPARTSYVEESYYLPHHPVVKPTAEKTRVRPVFNAASTVKGGRSLNQCLARGEPINCDLKTALVNFRTARVPLVSDMVKAFLQVRIAEEDRDYVRYFWFNDLNDSHPTLYRLKSLLFGANCSPHVLGAVLRRLFEEHGYQAPTLREAHSIIYMDDLIIDVENVEKVERVVDEAQEMLAKGSFGLHEWITTETARSQVDQRFFKAHEDGEISKCLGIAWTPKTDLLIIECKAQIPHTLTQRTAISFLAKLYDPLDLTLPFKVNVRKFCRELSLASHGWDAELSPEMTAKFNHLAMEYQEMRITVPRGVSGRLTRLIVFTDASPEAYGAVAYVVDENDCWMLLCAKGKLTRTKQTSENQKSASVPRLELCAALLGSELYVKLTASPRLKDLPCDIFSDSQVTLYRIKNGARLHPDHYVQNRLDRIHELTDGRVNWCYVRTHNNPADLLTHGRTYRSLLSEKLWWSGPETRLLEEDQRVMLTLKPEEEADLGETIKAAEKREVRSCVAVTSTPVISRERKSEWAAVLDLPYSQALVKVKEWIRQKDKTMEQRNVGKQLPLNEETYATMRLWRAVQRDLFGQDYDRIVANKPPEVHKLKVSNLEADEWGVLRTRRPLPPVFPFPVRRPIVMGDHPIWRTFVREEHHRLRHPGRNALAGHLASNFHAFNGKRIIQDQTRKCVFCNWSRGKPFSAPMAALPVDRTTEAETAFTSIGMDFFGPMHIAGGRKVYGLLMTCNRTRAVHLEVVTSLETANCLMAIKRFFARRGIPSEIRSDNGCTFHGANSALVRLVSKIQEASKDPKIARLNIKWYFNAPRAPWWGGHFERLVGAVKQKLSDVEWRRCSLEMVWTVLCEVEAILNSRPLTGINIDEPPLTPSHFITGRQLLELPTVPPLPNPEPVLSIYYKLRELTDHFWKKWTKEYVLSLKRCHQRLPNSRAPEVGEWVLIEDKPKPRGVWPLARVMKIYPGVDGVVRLADVETEDGRRFTRAVQSLIPLEASPATSRAPGEDVAVRDALDGNVI